MAEGVLSPMAGLSGGQFQAKISLLGERGLSAHAKTGQASDGVRLSENETCIC